MRKMTVEPFQILLIKLLTIRTLQFMEMVFKQDLCYVDDTIEGIYKLLNSSYNSPVNIGNPTEHSINELVKIIKSLTSSNSKITYLDLPENDPKVRQPDISIAKEFLQWEPKIDLFEGLLKTINYYKKL